MSSRSPLLLFSAARGADASAVCAATAGVLSSEGLRVVMIDATDVTTFNPAAAASLRESIGRVMSELGADPVHAAAWASAPGVSHLSVLRSALDALADPQADAVILDCGSLTRARELVEVPSVLVRLLDAALTPRMAMWRSRVDDRPTVFEALSGLRHEL